MRVLGNDLMRPDSVPARMALLDRLPGPDDVPTDFVLIAEGSEDIGGGTPAAATPSAATPGP